MVIKNWFILCSIILLSLGCAHSGSSPSPSQAKTEIALQSSEKTPSDVLDKDPEQKTTPNSTETAEISSFETDDTLEPDPFDESDPFDEPDPFDEADPFDTLEGGKKAQADLQVADPLIGFNRVMFYFNDKVYLWIVRPISIGYKAVIPSLVRTGIKNFFTNLAGPVRFVHCLLQGKGEQADHEFERFVMNTTIGVLGFGNPAKKYPRLEVKDEDVGQTFGRWGVGEGFYLVLPILGPSTLRDTVGQVGDMFMNPLTYVNPAEVSRGASGVKFLNESPELIDTYETIKDMAFDPYLSARDFYIQMRRKNIKE